MAPQVTTARRQLLESQVVENKLLLQLGEHRLGHIGSPVETLCSFPSRFKDLENRGVEPS